MSMTRHMVGFAILAILLAGCCDKQKMVEKKQETSCKEQCFKSLELGVNYRPTR